MKKNTDRGISILGILFLGVIIILILSYYHISIQSVVESPEAKGNFNYVAMVGSTIWNNYLKRPATYLWNDVFVDLIWKAFVNNLNRIKAGEPTEIESNAPTVSY